MSDRRIVLAAFALLAMPGFIAKGAADDAWPTKQAIRLIVPYAAGGSGDVAARMAANFMARSLNATVVVENRVGAGGAIGTLAVVKSPADGYSLCVCGSGSIVIGPVLQNVGYDPLNDLTPISIINVNSLILVVDSKSPPKTAQEFIAWAKSKPSGLTYGSSGTGGTQHIAAEVFQRRTGLKLVHVPYKGSNQAAAALLAGDIDAVFALPADVMGAIQQGTVRALGVTQPERSPLLPGVPTLEEQGIPDIDVTSWNALFGPRGLPRPIVDRLAGVIAEMAKDTEVKKMNINIGTTAAANTPDQFLRQLQTGIPRWKEYLSGITLK